MCKAPSKEGVFLFNPPASYSHDRQYKRPEEGVTDRLKAYLQQELTEWGTPGGVIRHKAVIWMPFASLQLRRWFPPSDSPPPIV